MILRTGLTGGIASGKSTVSRHFAALGCLTIDADAVVARLYRPGEEGHSALVRTYGREILLPNGTINRPKLAGIAFTDAAAAKQLNDLIHPLVIAEEGRMIDSEAARFPDRGRIVVVEATLLLESGGRARYDRIIVVDVAGDAQLARAIARGMDRDDAARRIALQMPRDERLRHADYVIDNNGDLRALEVETHRVFKKLQADLQNLKKG
jgi:dephospho-CoA kinase